MTGHREPQSSKRPQKNRGNVRYLDEWRAQHRRYFAAKTETLRRRKQRQSRPPGRTGSHAGERWPRPEAAATQQSLPAEQAAFPRKTSWLPWLMLPIVAAAGWVWLASSPAPARDAHPAPLPAVLRVWAPDLYGREAELEALLTGFEEAHGVQVTWQSGPIPPHELVQVMLAGPAPDVLLIDQETAVRLLGVDGLMPLGGDDSAQYWLQLGEENLWVRSLRAAIPRRAANPNLALSFLDYLSQTASAGD
ncbi:MAG: hypothetical protein H0Z37_11500 [Firmicutes bacterium]|nr:hypothetical protein [Bacillota bacterium]